MLVVKCHSVHNFTLQQEGPATSPPTKAEEGSIEIAVAVHYLDPPLSLTPRLQELLSTLPSWVTSIGWTSMYSNWVF